MWLQYNQEFDIWMKLHMNTFVFIFSHLNLIVRLLFLSVVTVDVN